MGAIQTALELENSKFASLPKTVQLASAAVNFPPPLLNFNEQVSGSFTSAAAASKPASGEVVVTLLWSRLRLSVPFDPALMMIVSPST